MSTTAVTPDLHVELLLDIERIGLRDLCAVEQGWHFFVLFCLFLQRNY